MNREKIIKVVCIFNSFNFNFATWKQQLSYNFSSHQNGCWSFKFSMYHLFDTLKEVLWYFNLFYLYVSFLNFPEKVLVDILTSHLYPVILKIHLILFKISFIKSDDDDEIQKWISFKMFNKIYFYKFDIFYYSLFRSSWNVFSFSC